MLKATGALKETREFWHLGDFITGGRWAAYVGGGVHRPRRLYCDLPLLVPVPKPPIYEGSGPLLLRLRSNNALVTGGAGFIGSHLVDLLVGQGWEVSVLDNLSSGRLEWIGPHLGKEGFRFLEGDINDPSILSEALAGCECVFHLAADPVIRGGFAGEDRRYSPMRNNILGTHVLLEAMGKAGAAGIAFASSSVVYGQASVVPTPEDYGPMKPISLYGASKLAAEALITAYSHGMGLNYWIFRFANIVGPRMGQGIIYDFVDKLKGDPNRLEILGDGKQMKCYLDAGDCVGAMLFCTQRTREEIFNLGTPTPIDANRIAQVVEEEMGLAGVDHVYTGGEAGWKGDLPVTVLSTDRLAELGWKASMDSEEAVRMATRHLLSSE
jgi:UDP-glucose 4-epimerase